MQVMTGAKMRAAMILAGAIVFLYQPATATPARPAPAPTAATAPQSDAERVAELERQQFELRYERDMERIHTDLVDRQTSWFEILVSSLVGLFALAVTGSTIFFTIRFGRAAVAEARNEVAQARSDFEEQLSKAQHRNQEAEALVAQIRAHEQIARQITEGLQPGQTPTDPVQRRTLREIASEAATKPRNERTLDHYRALVMVAAMDSDWTAMERRAAAMDYLFEDADPETQAFALFQRAYALGELSRQHEAIAIYDELIRRFGDSNAPALLERVVMALFNKGVDLGALERHDDAIATYDELIRRFGDSDTPALQEKVAMALLNKGVRFGTLERHDDAIATYDELIRRFGDSDAPALLERVAMALFNKVVDLGALDRHDDAIATYDEVVRRFGDSEVTALQEMVAMALFNRACARGAQSNAPAAIADLRLWAERIGSFDCNKIANDSDFDPIRNDPAFRALLVEYGCVPPAEDAA
jgi:tetratricopeptide (TPR) repeat protein